ncbi:DUF1707 SHOCT-like domain-containing protein [Propionibacteriaceae bacterium G1746]|uniref:DUF1707 SHOCT-like domain-containing protein n=1 Tax=Aestuariimicrobium sp. G57 TaxID=3418485 RepID=UPI003C1DAE82
MSNLPISSKYRSQAHLPVPDEEREDLGRRLNEAFTNGTIPAEQYPVLLDRVYDAQTLGDLAPVVELLPVKQTYDQPNIVQAGAGAPAPGELTQARPPGKLALYGVAGGIGAILLLALLILIIVL